MLRFAALLIFVCAQANAATETIRFDLPNGLRVILRPIQGAKQGAVIVQFDVGGNHDPAGKSGLAHLIEHVYCTAAAGKIKSRSAEQYMTAGGNAQTCEDFTFFAEQFEAGRLNAVLADNAARMQDLKPDQAILDREKGRVVAEVNNMFGGMPALAAANFARERVRPTPNGGRRGGLPEQVAKLTLSDIRNRWKHYYKSANATLVVAGGFDSKIVRPAIERLFGTIPIGERAPHAARPGSPRNGVTETIHVKAIQPGVGREASLTFNAPPFVSPDFAPFVVLATRFSVVSEELGAKMGQRFPPCVQYSVLEDPFTFSLGSPVQKGETPAQAITRIRRFAAKHASAPLSPGDRQTTRMMFGGFLGMYDPPDAQWAQNPYGLALSLARRASMQVDPAKLNHALDRLTSADLKRAATTVFGPLRGAAVVTIPR